MVGIKIWSQADFTCREQTFHNMSNMTISFAIAKAERDESTILQISACILDSVISFWEKKILNVLKMVTLEDF